MKHCIDCYNQPTYSPHARRCAECARIARNAQQIAYNQGKRKADKVKRDELRASVTRREKPAPPKPETWTGMNFSSGFGKSSGTRRQKAKI